MVTQVENVVFYFWAESGRHVLVPTFPEVTQIVMHLRTLQVGSYDCAELGDRAVDITTHIEGEAQHVVRRAQQGRRKEQRAQQERSASPLYM